MTLYLAWEGGGEGEGRVGEGREVGDDVKYCFIVECSLTIQTHASSVLLYLIVNTCCTCLALELRDQNS